nr:MAG TPA: Putative antitoxin [Caudoviricetes sp.]
MAKNKQIYMSPALMELETEMKAKGESFSARLGEIVERYGIILSLEEIPEFTEDEIEVLSEMVCGSYINCRKVRGLHLDALDVASGTEESRRAVSEKIEKMTAGQRLALIEKMGQ